MSIFIRLHPSQSHLNKIVRIVSVCKGLKMTELLGSGFTDTFRYFYPDAEGIYSWWSYRFKAREKNAGWRIDYFITSKRINDKLQKAAIHTDVFGSDHCPVEVDIEF